MLWSVLMMFITGAGSRNQFDCICDEDSDTFAENFARLSGCREGGLPTSKASADYLEQVDVGPLAELPVALVRRLIRSKVLDSARLLGTYFPIAIDLTGWLRFSKYHCEHCLVQNHEGTLRYYHPVAEAKLLTPSGMALSVATEFVENDNPRVSKQDCELAAFPRLLTKLRRTFPRLPICLLLDGIYPSEPMMALCRKYDMHWIASFKEGHLPTAFREFSLLKSDVPENVQERREDQRYQRLSWLGDLQQGKETFDAFDCLTYNEKQEQQYFAFCTSIHVNSRNCAELTNRGGRLRWKIENEGFNVQKNGDLQLEHVYSYDLNAAKAYYILLQTAHILLQLMWQGSLLKAARKRLHSMLNFVQRIREDLRNRPLPSTEELDAAARTCQIRMDTT